MRELREEACREYRDLSRRQFILNTAGAAALTAALPAWLPQVSFASEYSANRDVILSVFLRGGADGLTMVPPFGEDIYYQWRPSIAIPRPDSGQQYAALDLDGFFGLAQAMGGLYDAFQAGHLLVVHGTGSVDPSRSHFDAQRYMEVGKPSDPSVTTGWLGRHLASVPPYKSDAPLRALGVADGLARVLQGGPLTLPIPTPGTFDLAGATGTIPERRQRLERLYGGVSDPIYSSANNTLNTIDVLKQIDFANYMPGGGAVYPGNAFGNAIKSAAALVKAEVGVEAIHVDLGGWDYHNNMNPFVNGMAALMATLSNALGAFHTDIFSGTVTNVVVVVMSEFGRRVLENGSKGADHGHGNAMFVMGESIDGGRVLSNWPGLQQNQLFSGQDLQVTVDHRDILAEIVQKRLGNDNLPFVFPDYAPKFQGVVKS